MTTYFGFAIGDSMFPANCAVLKMPLNPTDPSVAEAIATAVPCLNPSHVATIQAMAVRYGLILTVPAKPPQVALVVGDCLIVAGVRDLPRLTDRHEYTAAEIDAATFGFSCYRVVETTEPNAAGET
jgi:hypothetical protein